MNRSERPVAIAIEDGQARNRCTVRQKLLFINGDVAVAVAIKISNGRQIHAKSARYAAVIYGSCALECAVAIPQFHGYAECINGDQVGLAIMIHVHGGEEYVISMRRGYGERRSF